MSSCRLRKSGAAPGKKRRGIELNRTCMRPTAMLSREPLKNRGGRYRSHIAAKSEARSAQIDCRKDSLPPLN